MTVRLAPDAPVAGAAQRTLLGMAMPIPPTPAGGAAGGAQPAFAPAAATRTLMGGAISPAPPQPEQPFVPQGAAPKRTLLGVAIPGIAPLNPGQAKLPVVPQEGSLDASPMEATGGLSEAELSLAGVPKRSAGKRLVLLLVLASVALMVIGAIAWYRWREATRLEVAVRTEANGEEVLDVLCRTCPDGSSLSSDGRTATFKGGHGKLGLARPLSVGDNTRTLEVKRPGRAVDRLEIAVPVDFRVRGDLSGLYEDRPVVYVQVDVRSGVSIQVEGRPVALDAQGHAKFPVDVEKELTGLNPKVAAFEKRIHYQVMRAATSTEGDVLVQIGVTPLEVTSPGLGLVTASGQFSVSGRTAPTARLIANGHPIVLQADGRFQQMMSLSSAGSTRLRLRATSPDHAPRLFEAEIESVSDLNARAQSWKASATLDFDATWAKAQTTERAIFALTGEVVEAAWDGQSTLLLVDVPCTQRPCLVRGHCGFRVDAKRGQSLSLFGKTRPGETTAGSSRVLSSDVYFVLEAKGP